VQASVSKKKSTMRLLACLTDFLSLATLAALPSELNGGGCNRAQENDQDGFSWLERGLGKFEIHRDPYESG